ncbi:type I restriction modification DNA specificity domain protein [Sinorhizobium sp. RAC02]|nr:type I restriction modification DNA specificity domain protein [Sinorhizobium sp. RAC02]
MQYKSPFGPIPRHWTVARLRDLTSKIGSGATPRGGEKAYLQKRQNYALIRSQSVHDRYFDTSSVSFITDDQAHSLRNAEVKDGDILLNITGDGVTFARSTIVPNRVLPACVNQHVAIVRPVPTLADAQYLMSFLASPEVKSYIEGFNAGGSRRAITKGHIESFEMPLPPLAEQEAIGSILSSLDDKIELNRRMNETLETMAQAIFRDWFVDFGPTRRKLEGATDPVAIMGGLVQDAERAQALADLLPAVLGDDGVPEGWHTKGLDEIADFLNGIALQKYPAADGEDSLPVIKIAELRSGITPKSGRASPSVPQKYIIHDRDFLFSWSGSLLAKFWTDGVGALNQHLFKVSSAVYPNWFFAHWIYYHMPEFQRIAASKATTMGHIQRSHLSAAQIICPHPATIEKMGEIIQPIVDRTIHNDLESRTLTSTRDLILPKLMSGEIRLDEAIEAAA